MKALKTEMKELVSETPTLSEMQEFSERDDIPFNMPTKYGSKKPEPNRYRPETFLNKFKDPREYHGLIPLWYLSVGSQIVPHMPTTAL